MAIPTQLNGKPATATHFNISGSKATPAVPVAIDPNTQWKESKTINGKSKPIGEKAVVTYVHDGDGVNLKRKDGSDITCRIDTIDAPEVANSYKKSPEQPFGNASRDLLRKMIANKEVTLIVSLARDPKDKTKENNYGRSLCKIEVQGKNVDAAMLQAGAAWLYREFGRNAKAPDATLSSIESKARGNKEGLWAGDNIETPYSFRKRNKLKE